MVSHSVVNELILLITRSVGLRAAIRTKLLFLLAVAVEPRTIKYVVEPRRPRLKKST